ncbi:hypothetical protein [Thiobacillus denitrificans]|uniref:hypothetical protein n=1 Tax=Thiobacillus denitrificans TaxID=36861 RepID=UPI00037080BE|nr:hypothetical protein [Thiobacillus denitrificans]
MLNHYQPVPKKRKYQGNNHGQSAKNHGFFSTARLAEAAWRKTRGENQQGNGERAKGNQLDNETAPDAQPTLKDGH